MVNRVISGPIQPGTSEQIFRRTGRSVSVTGPQSRPGSGTGGGGRSRVKAGPVRPGRDEVIFRRTGQSVTSGSVQAQSIRADFKRQDTEIAQSRAQERTEGIASRTISGQVQGQTQTQIGPIRSIQQQTLSRDTSKPRGFLGVSREVLFGRSGERFLGIGSSAGFGTGFDPFSIGAREPSLSLRDIKEFGRRGISPEFQQTIVTRGTPILSSFTPLSRGVSERVLSRGARVLSFEQQVISELIPTTPGGVGIIVGTFGIASAFPIARPIISTTFGVIGTRTALSSELTPQERVAGGLVGTLGFAGLGFEATPFIRGARARVSSEFAPVRTQPEGFSAIELRQGEIIGLIEPRSGSRTSGIDLPSQSPLIKGGFGRRPGGEELFLGRDQLVTTSQIGLFREGKTIPVEREFFVTPEEPFINIAETRVSRLGLTDLFQRQAQTEIGFGLPARPQIGIARADIGRIETQTQLRIGTGTELEAIKGFGEITGVSRIGKTVIKGQGVDIFQFSFGKGFGKVQSIKSPKISSSTGSLGRVSGEGLISTLGITSRTSRLSIPRVSSRGLSLPRSQDIFSPIKPGSGLTPRSGFPTSLSFPTRGTPSLRSFSLPKSSFSPPSVGDFFQTPIVTTKRVKTPKGKRVRGGPKKKVRRRTGLIRPSLTGIILDIEAPALPVSLGGADLGILPGQIRGLRTGFPSATRRIKSNKKATKKKITKKKKK